LLKSEESKKASSESKPSKKKKANSDDEYQDDYEEEEDGYGSDFGIDVKISLELIYFPQINPKVEMKIRKKRYLAAPIVVGRWLIGKYL
jgi:hypothetical protein